MISVVGTGLSLPFDGEPYGPGDSEYAAGQRLLRRVVGAWENALRSMWSSMGNSPPHRSCIRQASSVSAWWHG